MHVIEWVTKTVNRDGKNLRHLKSQKINFFQSFLYLWTFNLVFMCPTLCQLKTTCLWLMKQKLYALDAFFIEKLKLSENDPLTCKNQIKRKADKIRPPASRHLLLLLCWNTLDQRWSLRAFVRCGGVKRKFKSLKLCTWRCCLMVYWLKNRYCNLLFECIQLVNGDYVSWKHIPLNYCAGVKWKFICIFVCVNMLKTMGITVSSAAV